MFEKFTADARQVIIDAQQIARELRSGSIGTGEILVALLDHAATDALFAERLAPLGVEPSQIATRVRQAILEDDGLDAAALASLGIDLDTVQDKTDAVFGKGALASARRHDPGDHPPFTPGAKKALELALREAVRLKDKSIGARHLMLGILDSTDTTARALLTRALRASSEPDPAPRIEALRHSLAHD